MTQETHTVKPEMFTTFLFSRLSRITKIREIKKSEKFYIFSYLNISRVLLSCLVELKPTCLSIDLPQCQIYKHVLQLRIHTSIDYIHHSKLYLHLVKTSQVYDRL